MGSSRVGASQALGAERQEGQGAEDIGKKMTEMMSMNSQLDNSRKRRQEGLINCLEVPLGLNNCCIGIHARRELGEQEGGGSACRTLEVGGSTC